MNPFKPSWYQEWLDNKVERDARFLFSGRDLVDNPTVVYSKPKPQGLQIEVSDLAPEGTIYFMSLPPKEAQIHSLEDLAEWYRNHPNSCGKMTNVTIPSAPTSNG